MAKVFDTLKLIWTGNSSKKTYLIYFLSSLMVYIIGIIIGISTYPGGFSFLTVYTSYLGGTENNLDGYIYYNTCMFITGILLIPHFLFLSRRMQPAPKFLNNLLKLFGTIGIIGFGLIGIWHQGADPKGHQITTWLAFGGLGLAAFCYFILGIVKIIQKHTWPRWSTILLIYGQMSLLIGVTIWLGESEQWLIERGLNPLFSEGKFTEWLYVFIVMGWLIDTAIFAPADNNTKSRGKIDEVIR